MLKIPKRTSVNLSITVAAVFIIIIAVLSAAIPFIWEKTPYFSWLIKGIEVFGSTQTGQTLFFVWLYVALAVVEIFCIIAFFLLLRVRKGLVFTTRSVALIRSISWGCIILSLLFVVGQIFHPLMFVLALAAIFLGICLRVVKNVIEEATAIKAENDFTI